MTLAIKQFIMRIKIKKYIENEQTTNK